MSNFRLSTYFPGDNSECVLNRITSTTGKWWQRSLRRTRDKNTRERKETGIGDIEADGRCTGKGDRERERMGKLKCRREVCDSRPVGRICRNEERSGRERCEKRAERGELGASVDWALKTWGAGRVERNSGLEWTGEAGKRGDKRQYTPGYPGVLFEEGRRGGSGEAGTRTGTRRNVVCLRFKC